MANTKNLKKGNPGTEFQSGREAVEKGRKGGQKSGEVRRRKSDIKKMLQALLDETYNIKETPEKVSGTEAIIRKLIKKALNDQDKEQLAAIKYIFALLGADRNKEDINKIKAETKYLMAKIQAIAAEKWDSI